MLASQAPVRASGPDITPHATRCESRGRSSNLGQETLAAKAERSAKLAQLRDLEADMGLVGVLEGRVGGVGSRSQRDNITALSPNPVA